MIQVELKGHAKAVTSISLEPAGNRLVTGSLDYSTKLFDFGGMDARHKAFHSIEAHESHVSDCDENVCMYVCMYLCMKMFI